MQPVAITPAAVPDAAAWAPAAVDAPADAALHAATLQAAARPQATQAAQHAEAPRPADPTLPAADAANGFALPADQLLPVTLIGLQVQAGDAWPLSAQAWQEREGRRPHADDEDDGEGREGQRRRVAPPPAQEDPAPEPESAITAGPDDALPPVDAGPTDWLLPLARAINEALAAPQPPAELAAAAEQWSRGRCVLLVCPQAANAMADLEPAWAFVLWPRRGARPRGPLALRFGLSGQRMEARLQWPHGATRDWCSVRAVKQHLAHGGRQLVALDAAGAPGGAVPCEVQLGPVRAAAPRWRLAAVRVDAVRRLWGALGGQWSVLLVVCPQPLLSAVASPTVVEA